MQEATTSPADLPAPSADSESTYRAIIEDLPDLICRFRHDTTITFINNAYARCFGRPRGELIGSSFLDLIPPESHDDVRAHLALLGPDRPTETHEHRVIAGNGEVRWQRWTNRALVDDGGRVVEFQATGQDITEQRRATDALRESEERLRRTNEMERLLLRELDHRVRNNLASLVSLVDLTLRSAGSIDEFANAIRGRIHAMSTGHELLSRSSWAGLGLRHLIRALAPPDYPGAIAISDATIQVPAEQVSPLAMVLHELYTNSAKHGALADEGGRIEITCTARPLPGDHRNVSLRWRETGGPPIGDTVSARVGTSLIEGLARSDLRGDVTFAYPATGADHRLTMTFAPARRDRS